MSFWFALSHTVAHRTRNEGSRLCRLMCGGGSAPPELFTLITPGLRPAFGAQPQIRIMSRRKGTALPHIGRQSRKPRFYGPASIFAGFMSSGMNCRSIKSFMAIGLSKIPALTAMSLIRCKSSSVGVSIR